MLSNGAYQMEEPAPSKPFGHLSHLNVTLHTCKAINVISQPVCTVKVLIQKKQSYISQFLYDLTLYISFTSVEA
jgi:hypothetical protein